MNVLMYVLMYVCPVVEADELPVGEAAGGGAGAAGAASPAGGGGGAEGGAGEPEGRPGPAGAGGPGPGCHRYLTHVTAPHTLHHVHQG